ncbi:TSUP family transporter [Caminibacter pacificus]
MIEIYIIFFIASLIHGVVGFAFALIATPLLSLFLPVKEAVLLTIIPTIFINFLSSFRVGDFNLIKNYLLFFLFIGIGSVVGTFLLFVINQNLFLSFLVFVIWLYLFVDYKKIELKEIYKYKEVVAFISGVSAGIVNVMSPILLIYFLSSKKQKEEIIVVSNISFLIAKAIQMILFAKFVLFPKNYFFLTMMILAIEILGFYIGKKISSLKIIEGNYRLIVKWFIFIISLILLSKIINSILL